MAKAEPMKVEVDTKLLDVFIEALEGLLGEYDEQRVTPQSFAENVRELVAIRHKIPRSVTVDFEVNDE